MVIFVTDFFPGTHKLPLEICQAKESNGQQGLLKGPNQRQKRPPCYYIPLTLDFNKQTKKHTRVSDKVTSFQFLSWNVTFTIHESLGFAFEELC